MPVKRFGVGTPSSVRREPSVPPRIGVGEGLDADGAAGFARELDRAHVVLQPVAHVAVLLVIVQVIFARGSRGLRPPRRPPQHLPVARQPFALEIAQDESSSRPRPRSPLHLVTWKNPSRPSVVSGVRVACGSVSMILASQVQRVHQLVLGPAGMHRDALDPHRRRSAEKVS